MTSAVLVGQLSVLRGPSTVLSGLNLDIAAGEVVAVRGASGSGKSSLLAALAGLVPSDEGTIVVAGHQMNDRSDRARSKIRLQSMGLVFQRDELLPELTIGENVGLPSRILRRSPQETAARVGALLEALKIAELHDRLPSQISGGQLQRAAIARAMVNNPQVVLADEPTASLDSGAARSAIQLLVETVRERNAAAVVVTHDPEIARRCDRLVELHGGALTSVERQVGR
ncbi:hypothetical protein GCM10022234_22650 [Aeromicrobium panaciterrae]|uniref:ABC transporter ATP-binding protein n=1 Tax=Aeromicrobium panaciterrae TaxID=363861 RepID=UPI0031DA4C13